LFRPRFIDDTHCINQRLHFTVSSFDHKKIFFLMVEGETLNQLIEQLQQLHLEQETILQALEDITQQDIVVDQEPRANIVQGNECDRTPASTPAIVTVAAPVTVPAPVTTGFHIGQRVFITNRITHILVRRATEADRTAIVTHFTATRIAIHTINSYYTHRHPKNLRPFVTMSSGSSPPPPPTTSSGQANGTSNNNNYNDNSDGNARYHGSRN
jgi:hypothetical protein